MPRAERKHCALLLVPLLASGCSFAPRLDTPQVATTEAFKESGAWTQATPADRLPREGWWTLYANPELNDLQQRMLAGNPTIAAAAANYATAKALSDQANASLFPTLTANASVERSRESVNAPLRSATTPVYYDTNTLGGSLSYELDLWGQIRNEVKAGKAAAEAAAADFENARLSMSAQLADDYIQLRSLDHTNAILSDAVAAYAKALALTQQRHDAGIAPGLDVAQAQTQLQAAQAQLSQSLAERATMEHAIAALLGLSASAFSLPPAQVDIAVPHVPTEVPASLLQRRPDIAAAQRRMLAANAEIGVARAAYFPQLTLAAQGGVQSKSFSNWLTAPSSYWAIGPNALLTVFDAGLHRAQVAQARAEFDASAANYRGVVLGAFQQVEDSLASLNHDHDASVQERAAVEAAQTSLNMSTALYTRGAVGYLTVITAQTTLLQDQLQALNLDTLQLHASVALIRALGGGWEQPDQG